MQPLDIDQNKYGPLILEQQAMAINGNRIFFVSNDTTTPGYLHVKKKLTQ